MDRNEKKESLRLGISEDALLISNPVTDRKTRFGWRNAMIIATVMIAASAAGVGALKVAPSFIDPLAETHAKKAAPVAKATPAPAPQQTAPAQMPAQMAEAKPEKRPEAKSEVKVAETPVSTVAASVKSAVLDGFSRLEDHFRLDHARELMGKYYEKSVVRKAGEKADEIDRFALETVERKLTGKWKPAAEQIYLSIKTESRRFGFDPLFLIAVIDGESSFKPEIRGPVGEIGMMQLRSETAKWISEKYNMPYRGDKSLEDPITNIQIGAAFLAYLRDQHDSHGRLYLSAYNMGSRNVKRALDKNVWPKDYAQHVMRRYVKLYSKLKQSIQDRSSASDEG